MKLNCHVKPNNKAEGISLQPDGSLRIKIKAPPVKGKANEYLVAYLAGIFRLPKKNIQIISGFTSSHKRINIVAEEEQVRAVLQNL